MAIKEPPDESGATIIPIKEDTPRMGARPNRRTRTLAQAFGPNLARERIKARLTQQQLAVRAELSVSYVGMLERSERMPAIDTLDTLAAALGIAVNRLTEIT